MSIGYGILLLGVGVLDLYLSVRFIRDKQFAENYVKKSPKAWLWRKLLGEERALKLTRKVFAPIGVAVGVILVLMGLGLLI